MIWNKESLFIFIKHTLRNGTGILVDYLRVWMSYINNLFFTYAVNPAFLLLSLTVSAQWSKNQQQWIENSLVNEPITRVDTFFPTFPADSFVIARASDIYQKGFFFRWAAGKNYSEVWYHPFAFPVLKLKEDGYEIVEKGDGKQTLSLVLKKQGKFFALRSVQKNVSKFIPASLQGTGLHYAAQYGVTSQFPYGALVASALAALVKVPHTNPQFVWVGDENSLDPLPIFKNRLFLLEERPEGDWSDVASLLSASEYISTSDMQQALKEKNARVDTLSYLKARLFDILIGDWDRHPRQWRWAVKKHFDKTIYIPIPRDRDQAFYKIDGWVSKILASRMISRQITPFDCKLKDMQGMIMKTRELDHSLLLKIPLELWLETANQFQQLLTNEDINAAVKKLPQSLHAIVGREITDVLKCRRDSLDNLAKRYYEALRKNE